MNTFNTTKSNSENRFVRNNEEVLLHYFGTREVNSFWIADMDFEIAKPITDELGRLVDRGVFAYEFSTTELNLSISNWFNSRHHLSLNPNNFLQVPSVLTAISVLLQKFSEPEDGILIQTPVYHQFFAAINNVNRIVVVSPLINTSGAYTMDFKDLEEKFKSGKVKMMILCNPHNPIGRVWKKQELQTLLNLANQYGIKIISEIYFWGS